MEYEWRGRGIGGGEERCRRRKRYGGSPVLYTLQPAGQMRRGVTPGRRSPGGMEARGPREGFYLQKEKVIQFFHSGLPPVMGSVLDKVSDDSKVLAINV